MKKITAGLAAVALGGVLALTAALPSSAHTYGVEATCEDGLTVGLYNYHPTIPGKDAVPATDPIPGQHHDAIGEPTITVDNPDYVPAKDAVPPVTHIEYQFKQIITGHIKWNANPDWNPGLGWYKTGVTQTITDVPGQDAVPAQGEPTIEVPNPDYKPAYDDPETPGTPGQEAGAEQHNHITIIRNGEPFVDSDFSDKFQENYPTPDKTKDYTYEVTVTSLDGIGAFHKVLTTNACETPTPGAANPKGSIDTSCGTAQVNMENPGENILTASFVLYVDGDFYNAYAVQAGDHQKVNLNFDEDSGDHTIELRTGPAQGDELVASATVKSDCKPAVVTPPTNPPATQTPTPTPSNPAPAASTPAAKVIDTVSEDTLAHTGSNIEDYSGIGFIGGSILIAGIGTAIAAGFYSRRAKPRQQK